MKKIMFNDRYGLTEAVLKGRKTMTRRIIPPIEIEWARRGKVILPVSGFRNGWLWMDCRQILPDSGLLDYVAPQKYQPLYDIGEEVAVAQAYENIDIDEVSRKGINLNLQKDGHLKGLFDLPGWTNKMFVRADAMPHAIRITGIKMERLQDISDEDCLKEGVSAGPIDGWYVHGIGMTIPKSAMTPIAKTADGKPYYGDRYRDFKFDSPRAAFAALIDKTCGKGTWDGNPWTFAYEFELIR